jgi:hypothetical protein
MDAQAGVPGAYGRTTARQTESTSAAWIAVTLGVVVVAIATAGMLRGREPFASWYYIFVWYGTLVAADGVVALTGGAGERGRFLLLDRPAHALTVLGWSAVIWFFYELLNFRLQNWYYVFLPNHAGVRWSGTVLSFATVLPAVFLSMAVLRGLGVARDVRWRPLRVTPRLLTRMQIAGIGMMLLVLVWPRYFFPLVWGATTFFVEPIVYRKEPRRSLLGDLAEGRPTRLLRLLFGGAAIGLLWELYNVRARMKWIYTVPGLEDVKLFEMPVLGFFGFPPFAVECFVLWQALVVAGVAVPRWSSARSAPRRRRILAAGAAVAFSILVLVGMEARTVSSLGVRLTDLPGVPAGTLQAAGFDAFSLAKAESRDVAAVANVADREASVWVETARVATLRGIGAEYVRVLRDLGIQSVADLAAQDPARLTSAVQQATGRAMPEARVRVWVRGARHETVE